MDENRWRGPVHRHASKPGRAAGSRIWCHENETPIHVLGGGSNVLVRDDGVSGVVLRLTDSAFGNVEVDGTIVRAGATALLSHVISESVMAGLAGLESLVGIPGTIGGALRGNAGGKN